VWVDETLHNAGLDLLVDRRKRLLSLVDAVSFIVMRQRGVAEAFAIDPHFDQEGFFARYIMKALVTGVARGCGWKGRSEQDDQSIRSHPKKFEPTSPIRFVNRVLITILCRPKRRCEELNGVRKS